MKFSVGEPACPVACKYCFITEHDSRREVWNLNPIAGINRACTFVNVTPWIAADTDEQKRFSAFNWSALTGDYVGFTAITDPFYPRIDRWLWEWLDNASAVAKLTTCVTKWGISRKVMARLAQYPNFFLVLGITGNFSIEKTPLKSHLNTLALAKEYGVPCLPISHPYIAGISDLSFLPQVKALGYNFFDVKGLRYCDANMGAWMPNAAKAHYMGREDEEVLPEDGWRERVAEAGLTLLSPRQWYILEAKQRKLQPHLSMEDAIEKVKAIMAMANVVTSSNADEVIAAAINRRL